MKKENPERKQQIGIFWFIKANGQFYIIIDSVPYDQGEAYGEVIQYGGHYEYWENLIPKNQSEILLKTNPYDYYPRGRVVLFKKRKTMRIYTDGCLTAEDLKMVSKAFALRGSTFKIEFALDEHYKCARCNPHYIDI